MFRIAPPNGLRVNIRHFMKRSCLLEFALVGATAVLFCSCEEMPQQIQKPLAAIMPAPEPGWWSDEGASGEPRIVVHLTEQKAYFFKGKHLVGESTVSTGKKGFSTPPGHYSIVSKDRTISRANSVITSTATATSWCKTSMCEKIASRAGRISIQRGCRIACTSTAVTRCTRATSRRLRHRTVAFVCRKGWRHGSITTRRWVRR